MLKEERHQYILDKLNQESKVSSIGLSLDLGVSEDTIRRDLSELSEKGLLKKVYGGAVPTSILQLTFTAREGKATEEKIKLAQKVIPLFRENQLILLDGGTTNLQVARLLPTDIQLKVATNSIPVAIELINHSNIEVLLMGGKVLNEEQVSTGVQVMETLETLRPDICLIGVCSIHPVAGLTVPDSDLAHIKRKMIQVSTQSIALTTAEKLDTIDHYKVCNLDKLAKIVTPFQSADDILRPYIHLGISFL